jgi:tripartite-type tricarboxylate transporter receptor subunit TctC
MAGVVASRAQTMGLTTMVRDAVNLRSGRRATAGARMRCLAALAGVVLLGAAAAAQEAYPTRAITMIVPFAPGGTTDVIARFMAEALRGALGQPVIVDNRGGAGGTIGTAALTKAAPDGYTIGMGTASTLAINPAVYRNLSFDVLKDLAPIGNVAAVPNIMTINPALPAKDMAEFIRYAHAHDGKMSYGSAGTGSVSHLMGEQFRLAIKADIVHVPYRGVGPGLNDAVGGQIQVMYDNLPSTLPLVQAGKLRALGVSSPARLAALPDVPTFRELKLDDLDWMAFFGLVAPAGTPRPVIARLNAALVKVLAVPDLRDKLAAQQALVVGNSPAAFAAEIARELDRFRRAVAAANIKVE